MSKIALVTGGSRGIGAAIGKELGKIGYDVAIVCRRPGAGSEDVLEDIRGGGRRAIAIVADLESPEAFDTIARGVSEFGGGRLDLLVNNAGIVRAGPLDGLSPEGAEAQWRVNVLAPLLLAKAVLPMLREFGGRIVNISSVNARAPVQMAAVYSGTKAALEAITRSLALELGPSGIRVNAVAPGLTDTDMLRASLAPEAERQVIASTALGRLGTPLDIARAVAFLASPESDWITGEVITASGGLSMR